MTRSVDSRFTTPGDAMRALRQKMNDAVMLPTERWFKCGTCLDSGWVELDTDQRGTVGRCPKGCQPPMRVSAQHKAKTVHADEEIS